MMRLKRALEEYVIGGIDTIKWLEDPAAPVLGYLTEDCCGGRPELCAPLTANKEHCNG
jgi:hypothetical protein